MLGSWKSPRATFSSLYTWLSGPAFSQYSCIIRSTADALWMQIVKTFDTTVTLDAKDRFTTIAQACRTTLLDSARVCTSRKPLETFETFHENLAKVMHETWVVHQEAYLAHGDAAPFLGKSSACMYVFIRRTLGVPILHSERIRTPSTEQASAEIQQAPTVGSYTFMVYRALRDGRVIVPLQYILQRGTLSDF